MAGPASGVSGLPVDVGGGVQRGLLGLGLVVLLLFEPALLGGRVFFQRDVLSYWYPQVESLVRTVARDHELPLWNRDFGFGMPMLEDPGYQVFYPPTWLNFLVEPPVYYTGFVAAHCLLGGAGLLVLALRLGLPSRAAFVSAVAWSAGGPFLSAANLNHHFAGAAWMPWVLVALDRALRRGTVSSAAGLGLVAGLQILAGSGDMSLATAALGAGWLLHYCCSGVQPPMRSLGRVARLAGVAAAFGVALAAAQLLPTLALVNSSPRAALDPATNLYWSVHPLSLLDVVVDRAVADFPMNSGIRAVLFEGRQPLLVSLYLGLPGVLLGLFALAAPASRRTAWWILAGVAAALLFALGRHAPLAPLLVKLPLLSLFRYPAKAMIPASLLWALLVGLGVQAWSSDLGPPERRRARALACLAAVLGVLELAASRWVWSKPEMLRSLAVAGPAAGEDLAGLVNALRGAGVVAVLAGGLWLARSLHARAREGLSAALLLLLLGDWVARGKTVNPLAPPDLYHHKPALLTLLAGRGEGARIFADLYPGAFAFEPVRGPAGWERWPSAALGALDAIRPPVGARWGIRGSFDGDFTGLGPPAQTALTQLLLRDRTTPLAHTLLVLGGVDYVIGLSEKPFEGLQPVGEFQSVFASPLRVFRVEGTLPKVYMVAQARFALGAAAAQAALADPGFDPHAEVVLEAAPRPQERVPRLEGALRVLEQRSDLLRLSVTANAPAYVVVVESHHPGWQAWLDGRPTPVLRANALFRGVAVPGGVHVVEMRYRPALAAAGILLSALALAAAGCVWLAARRLASRGSAH